MVEKAHLVKWVGSATLPAPARVNRDRATFVLLLLRKASLQHMVLEWSALPSTGG